LQQAGVDVTVGMLEKECLALNKRFFTFHTQHRPYIILKWAQTANKKIASGTAERLLISNRYSSTLVHKWRSEEMGILIGTNTAMLDDPELTNRLWTGKSPVRLIVDMKLRLPDHLKILQEGISTIVFNEHQHAMENFSVENNAGSVCYYQVTNDVNIIHQVLNACYQNKIQSIIVEGGAKLLQSFIEKECGMKQESSPMNR
jgi:diaminohydroxyphosphoribosylaminopyrimidine deaminase/5-amino-6-(5-phosphoribosylamino)uracil reductase